LSRLWITGVGAISGVGPDAIATMKRLVAGERALAPVTLFDVSAMRCKIAAEVGGLVVRDVAPAGQSERWSRTDALALIAAREAMTGARAFGAAPIDLIIGGSTGGMFEGETVLADMHEDPARRIPDPAIARQPLASTADRLRETLGPFRHARTLCSACASGISAIALAAAWLRAGHSERVLVGAADALSRLTFAGFDALKVTDVASCRPFDVARAGMNLGEGAAFVFLETDASARARNAAPLAELAGYALGTEAAHITQPEESGATVQRLLERALEVSGIAPGAVDWVHAHGTGTAKNDAMEARALRAALGDGGAHVSSSKGQLGHTLAAAGAFGAAIATLAIVRGEMPPTGGLENPDPACDVPLVFGRGRQAKVRVALANAFGFGGMDGVLVLSEPELALERPGPHRRGVVVTGGATLGPLGALGSAASRAYADAGPPPAPGPLSVSIDEGLDLDRARRFDRCTRMLTAVIGRALDGARTARLDPTRIGAIGATAFGPVDESAAYCARSRSAGWKSPGPAAFPNLVPSSPIAHAAIYHHLRGPSFVLAELGTSSEIAALTAIDLIEDGDVDAVCVGSFADGCAIVTQAFNPLLLGSDGWRFPATEGAAALVLEAEAEAIARGAPVLATVAAAEAGFGAPRIPPRPDVPRASVVIARASAPLLEAIARSGWRDAPAVDVSARAGGHESNGGFALVVGASILEAGDADAVLVVGGGIDRWAAFVLTSMAALPDRSNEEDSWTETPSSPS
jgi:3-oxoacyl-[acyl-carrier-protein] synthase II